MDPNPVKDFFISYNKADRAWAEWIGWQLEEQGYTCIIQAWDFLAGGNFVLDMQRGATGAQRTIAVLSPDYLKALYTQPEWAAAFAKDPTGKDSTLLPVRVRECELEGILAPIVYIDLVTLDESNARTTLLAGVRRMRAKPSGPLPFPGDTSPPPKAPASFPGKWPEIWEVPYRRNPFFTGREDMLKSLYEKLSSQKTMALTQQAQAISGLGGIGKTQTALEYAYRHQREYRYVLWVTAYTSEGLSANYVKLAEIVKAPERDEKDQQITINAFKRWLATQCDWLLILDNADEVEMVRDFLPDGPHVPGHILLTTRAQALGGIAEIIDIEKMGKEEGVAFLLRRARVNANDASELTAAKAIVTELDGFPLALDQAGAYVEETGCSLTIYLNLYQTRRKELLERRGRLVKDHPETVATTWDISIKKVKQENPAAVALLQLCAFLAPDAIQEEMITEGAEYLGKELGPVVADEFLLNEAIEVLRRYSLVKRNQAMKTLSMHRLVQAVFKDGMNSEIQQQWAERTVQVVSNVFPFGKYENWEQCRRYLPHTQSCIELIKFHKIELSEASELLHNTGKYFYEQREYKQAEELHQEALSIKEKTLGLEHPKTANTLHELGCVYHKQGQQEQAKRCYEQALSIFEKTQGHEHLNTASTLHQLGLLYRDQGQQEQAKRCYEQALSIKEKTLGSEHSTMAPTYGVLAQLFYVQGNYERAEQLYRQALSIFEKTQGHEHPGSATSLQELGNLYLKQGKYEQAKQFHQQALSIREKIFGLEHPDTATTLHSLAVFYYRQKQYEQAETLYQQALGIREKVLGLDHPRTINTIKWYAYLFYQTNRKTEAEALLARINLTLDDLFS
jgi:tetratricopeptide (TPR) repeat protein